jgi:NADH-quinone oxidoreductase subunit N
MEKLAFNPTGDLGLFAPEILLAALGAVVLAIAVTARNRYPLAAPIVALLGLLVCLPLSASLWRHEENVIFLGSYAVDDLAVFFKLIAITIGGLVILASVSFMRRAQGEYGEFFALLVWAVLGLCLMAGASDLIVILLSIEMVSIVSYVLTGYFRREPRSAEASLKYFLFGAAASAVMLYGLSLLYGAAGTTKIYGLFGEAGQLARNLELRPSILQPIAAVLILAGLGFKIAMVPFHWWAPDAYEGAPTPVTAFLSVGPKAAGFAIIARLFMQHDNAIYAQWPAIVAWLAVATMFIGNWTAIWQTNIKRMLAYSSIAHAGYMLIGIVAWRGAAWEVDQPWGSPTQHGGLHAVLFYIAAYLFMNMGAFGVAIAVEQATGSASIDEYRGLAQRAPFLAIAMVIFLLSLSGIPPLAGFFGKYYVFNAAIRNERFVWLAVVGVINSVIAVYYYMNVVRLMYFRQPLDSDAEDAALRPQPAAGLQSVVIITLIVTILLGILPNPLVRFLSDSLLPGGLS